MKEFDLADLSPADGYKLFRNVVTPRPIALVTTTDADGVVNAAPFSFFNAISFDPCMVVLGIEARPDGSPKDTSANIRMQRQFVVNLVDHAMAEKMNACSTPLPPGESEIPLAGFELAESRQVSPPRIAEAPVALECERHTTLELGNLREIVVGEVKVIAIRPDLVNEENLHVDHVGLDTIGRMGASYYSTTRDFFEMHRPDGR